MYVRKCIKAHQSKPLFNDVNKMLVTVYFDEILRTYGNC